MKKTLLPSLLFVLLIAANQNVLSQRGPLPPPDACCSSIITGDLEQTKQWYIETLQFEIANEFRNEDRGIAIINLRCGAVQLELIEIAGSINPDSLRKPSTRLQGLFKFGFRVQEFDTWITHLRTSIPNITAQVVTDPVSDKRMIVIRDPEGNRIQIFEE